MSDFYLFHKGKKEQFTEHFNSSEFECHCAYDLCKLSCIQKKIVESLQRIRDILGVPLHINRGFSCVQHQTDLTNIGAPTSKGISKHTVGMAVDIRFPVGIDKQVFIDALKKEFVGVGVSKTFVHVDNRKGNKVYWEY